jgi:hypothetical protein
MLAVYVFWIHGVGMGELWSIAEQRESVGQHIASLSHPEVELNL